ncbi:hypothetical protein [Sphingomonas sp. NFX23]|uniref:hypothetical protein n=1 Tax=Sphingomonas sp. NFX23 TaxID=2819532 RepID=UPI003CEB130B
MTTGVTYHIESADFSNSTPIYHYTATTRNELDALRLAHERSGYFSRQGGDYLVRFHLNHLLDAATARPTFEVK